MRCACGHDDACHADTYLEPNTKPCLHGLPALEWGGSLSDEELATGVCRYDGRPWREDCACRDYVEATP